MAKLTWKPILKILGKNASTTQLGSTVTGTPVTSDDPNVLMNNAEAGLKANWQSVTVNGTVHYLPIASEWEGIHKANDMWKMQLEQRGLVEYSSLQTYYINSIVVNSTNGYVYASLADDNIGNLLTDTTKWAFLFSISSFPSVASQAEVNAGSNQAKFLSPYTFANSSQIASINTTLNSHTSTLNSHTTSIANLTNNSITVVASSFNQSAGYIKYSNGYTEQWGIKSTPDGVTAYTITLPIAFNTQCLSLQATVKGSDFSGGGFEGVYAEILSNSQIRVTRDYTISFNNPQVYWWCAGN